MPFPAAGGPGRGGQPGQGQHPDTLSVWRNSRAAEPEVPGVPVSKHHGNPGTQRGPQALPAAVLPSPLQSRPPPSPPPGLSALWGRKHPSEP